jgi:hypothetical protein
MVAIVATIGTVILAAAIYLIDKNADRRDNVQDN